MRPLAQCPYFPKGRQPVVVSGQYVSVPFKNVVGGNLDKRIKVFNFDAVDLPPRQRKYLVDSQIRRIGKSKVNYSDLVAQFIDDIVILPEVA